MSRGVGQQAESRASPISSPCSFIDESGSASATREGRGPTQRRRLVEVGCSEAAHKRRDSGLHLNTKSKFELRLAFQFSL